MSIIFFLVSLIASVAGAICGIGGGVIIKPSLDIFNLMSVSAISFLSGCTVLSMTCYSVGRNLLSGSNAIDKRTATPLAIGAAVGGVLGKYLFSEVSGLFDNANTVGAVQSVILLAVTLGTLVYTLKKTTIVTKSINNVAVCVVIGLLLGIMSSFLGIGGGPVNLVVLSFFFSLDSKSSAQNSLYIILFSQSASLISSLVTGIVPQFEWHYLLVMIAGGIAGGILGRSFNKRMGNRAVDKLFTALMCVIIVICVYNTWQFAIL